MRVISLRKRTLLYSLAIVLLMALFALLFIYVRQTYRVKVTKGSVHHTLGIGEMKLKNVAPSFDINTYGQWIIIFVVPSVYPVKVVDGKCHAF